MSNARSQQPLLIASVRSCYRRRLTTTCLAVAAGGIGVGLLAGCGRSGNETYAASPAAAPTTQTAPAADSELTWIQPRRQTLRRYAPAVGSLHARQTTQIGAQVSGRVEQVLVEVGDVVKKGQVLVRLDPAFFELDVQQASATVDAAKAAVQRSEVEMDYATRELKRQQDLFQRGAGSAKERDDGDTAFRRAAASLTQTRALLTESERRLEYAQKRLDESVVRAPYDGVVTKRLVDHGESATSTPVTHLLELQETGVLYLEFCLPQELFGAVKAGSALEYELEGYGKQTRGAEIAVVFPAIDETTRSFRCRAIVNNEKLELHPGALAAVRVIEREVRNALVVPRGVLSQTAKGYELQVDREGRPVATPVQTGLMTDDLAEVTGGVTESARVLLPRMAR
jgi:membrane fusion protein, multidrug efflux system